VPWSSPSTDSSLDMKLVFATMFCDMSSEGELSKLFEVNERVDLFLGDTPGLVLLFLLIVLECDCELELERLAGVGLTPKSQSLSFLDTTLVSVTGSKSLVYVSSVSLFTVLEKDSLQLSIQSLFSSTWIHFSILLASIKCAKSKGRIS